MDEARHPLGAKGVEEELRPLRVDRHRDLHPEIGTDGRRAVNHRVHAADGSAQRSAIEEGPHHRVGAERGDERRPGLAPDEAAYLSAIASERAHDGAAEEAGCSGDEDTSNARQRQRMKYRKSMLAVTGIGVTSPIGVGHAAFWDAIVHGRHAIRPVDRFELRELPGVVAATLPTEAMESILLAHASVTNAADDCAALALTAAKEALDSSRVVERVRADRIAIVLGTSAGGLGARSAYEHTPESDAARRHALLERSGFHVQTAAVAKALGVAGPRLTVSTACASSVHALLHARALLRAGRADAVLVGGVDVLVEELFAGFAAMGAMSDGPCAPFSEPVGMTLGEGAAFLVVEPADRAKEPWGFVRGLGASADAWHATAPDPTGRGIALAIKDALADAAVEAGNIGYVNAHGTGTDANDVAECRALRLALAARADGVPISSTKGHFGHALGAAGMLEIVATLLASSKSMVPPTLHYRGDRGGGPRDPVAQEGPRSHDYSHALSLSLAFGGTNGVAVLSRDASGSSRATPRVSDESGSEIVVLGMGVLSAHGAGDPSEALQRGDPIAGTVPEGALAEALAGQDRRGMDRCTELAIGAATLALRDAQLKIRADLRDRVGIVAGAPRLAWGSADAFWGSIRARGLHRASAPAFSGLVMNAPAGAVSRALGLRGLLSVVCAGTCSALGAVAAAADLLAAPSSTDVLLATSTFELSSGMRADHAFRFGSAGPPPGEAAVCFVLARASWAAARGLPVAARIASTTILSPDADASRDSDVDGVVDARSVTPTFGHGEAMDGLALACAVADVRAGRRTSARARGVDGAAGTFVVDVQRASAGGPS